MKLWEKDKEQNLGADRETIVQRLCPDECLKDGKKYKKDCQYTTCDRCWDQEYREET